MATQLAEAFQPEAADGAQDGAGAPVERDYEAEAKQHGWTPKEEFKGDPSRWSDAETFIKRADEVMPLLKKKTEAQDRRIKELERTIKDATAHYSKLEERTYARAITDLKARQVAAVEVGDVAAHDAVTKEIDALTAEAKAPKAANDIALEAKEAEIDWREKNPWYDKNALARDYAGLIAEKNKAKAQDMAPADFFDFITEEVLKRYPDVAKAEAAAERRPINPVEGGATNRRAAGGKGWADMAPEERRVAQGIAGRMVKAGYMKHVDDYLKDYDWSKK